MSSYRPQKYLSNSKLTITWTIWRLEDWNMLELPILRSCNFDLENHSHSAQIRNVHSSCLKEKHPCCPCSVLKPFLFLGEIPWFTNGFTRKTSPPARASGGTCRWCSAWNSRWKSLQDSAFKPRFWREKISSNIYIYIYICIYIYIYLHIYIYI